MNNELAEGLPARAFEELPYGIAIVDASARPVGVNRFVRELLGRALPDYDDERLCCSLLGCRRREPLLSLCVVEQTLGLGEAMPETRVEFPEPIEHPIAGELASVWVTATPLDGHVVMHLRPAPSGDRRHRVDPHWHLAPLYIRTLGPFEVVSADGSVREEWLHKRPGRILKFLVCQRGRRVLPDEIAEALRPDDLETGPEGNVRYSIHRLRNQLEPGRAPGTPSSYVATHGEGYSLDPRHVVIDADQLQALATTGAHAFDVGRREQARATLTEAMSLYRGDFLEEERYAVWALEERDRLRALAADSCRLLGRLWLEEGELQSARPHLERLLALEPWDTPVQRALIVLYLKLGRRSDAFRTYELTRQRMRRVFDEEPDFHFADISADDELDLS